MISRRSGYSFKVNYQNQNTKKIKYYFFTFFGKVFYFLLLIVSLILINTSISTKVFDSVVRSNVIKLSRQISIIAELPFNLLFDFTKGIKNLMLTNLQNKKLTNENLALKKLYIESLDIKSENENLKKFLNFKNNIEEKYNYITSRIYINPKNGMISSIIINTGSDDGIIEGSLVAGIGGGIIGRVVNVGKKYSNVLLLNDINSRIPARTETTKERIILSGTNKENLEISYFYSKFPEINEGDYVYTSGDSDMIPDGFIIGKIKKSENKFIVEMNENLNTIFNVMIIVPIEKQKVE